MTTSYAPARFSPTARDLPVLAAATWRARGGRELLAVAAVGGLVMAASGHIIIAAVFATGFASMVAALVWCEHHDALRGLERALGTSGARQLLLSEKWASPTQAWWAHRHGLDVSDEARAA